MADNASYREDNSLPKAYAYVTACEVWLTVWAFREAATPGTKTVLTPELIHKRLECCLQWISGQPQPRPQTGGNVVGLSVRGFRDDPCPGIGGPGEW